MAETYKTEYYIFNDEPVTIFQEDGQVKTRTKAGQPKPFIAVLENGKPITKEEYDNS